MWKCKRAKKEYFIAHWLVNLFFLLAHVTVEAMVHLLKYHDCCSCARPLSLVCLNAGGHYPPPPGHFPQPMPGQMGPGPGHFVHMGGHTATVLAPPGAATTVTVLQGEMFQTSPVQTVCPHCQQAIVTRISHDIGLMNTLFCLFCFFVG